MSEFSFTPSDYSKAKMSITGDVGLNKTDNTMLIGLGLVVVGLVWAYRNKTGGFPLVDEFSKILDINKKVSK